MLVFQVSLMQILNWPFYLKLCFDHLNKFIQIDYIANDISRIRLLEVKK